MQQHEKKEDDYVVSDDTSKDDVLAIPHDVQQLQQKYHTLVTVRQSTRQIRPPERFSPSLYSILLTDTSEPKCYDEAM